jgi:hypothetical protein
MPTIGDLCRLLCLGTMGSLVAAGAAAAADCATYAKQAERDYEIPTGLVQAIAQVESGHKPWALAVGGRTLVPDSREEAARVVRSRPAKGIFVGCMQLSVKHHEAAFDSKLDMLDPEENVDYGAQLLVQLQEATGSWTKAVQRYQGGRPEQQRRYVCKIVSKLKDIDPTSPALEELPTCGAKTAARSRTAAKPPAEEASPTF